MMSVNAAILQISKPEGDCDKEARLREKQPWENQTQSGDQLSFGQSERKRYDVDRGTSHKH